MMFSVSLFQPPPPSENLWATTQSADMRGGIPKKLKYQVTEALRSLSEVNELCCHFYGRYNSDIVKLLWTLSI